MTRTQHLLAKISEECHEVGQRAIKAIIFGPEEVQPGQPATNADRVVAELIDLEAVCDMLADMGVLNWPTECAIDQLKAKKRQKVERFLAFSAARGHTEGTIDHDHPHPEAIEG